MTVTSHAVRSYRTISPLPTEVGGIFLLHWPSVLTAQALPGTLPYGARTFLYPIIEIIEQRLPSQLPQRKIQGNRAKRKKEIGQETKAPLKQLIPLALQKTKKSGHGLIFKTPLIFQEFKLPAFFLYGEFQHGIHEYKLI